MVSPILADRKVKFSGGTLEQLFAGTTAYPGSTGRGFLIALYPKSGRIVWKYDVGPKLCNGHHPDAGVSVRSYPSKRQATAAERLQHKVQSHCTTIGTAYADASSAAASRFFATWLTSRLLGPG